jgi:hypothetical protein
MVAYEFYSREEIGKEHLIGILPERRKNPEGITEAIGDNSGVNNINFFRVEI